MVLPVSPRMRENFKRLVCAVYQGCGGTSSAMELKATVTSNGEPKKKVFNFLNYKQRRVALRIAYLGWNYSGFEAQKSTDSTVQAKLTESMIKTKLIQDAKSCNFSCCGRTDAGVSAVGQVVSLHVRSNLLEGEGLFTPDGYEPRKCKATTDSPPSELNYVHMLNQNLPEDIWVLSWCPVGEDFTARFSCLYRTYKYFFPLANMDLELLRNAGSRLVGEHDFRNFCKMDVKSGLKNPVRRILSVNIDKVEDSDKDVGRCPEAANPSQLYVATIKGQAFLRHQVRCMVSVLFLAGNRLESPDVIDHMLDISKCPRKPQYGMASEIPLILYDTGFDGLRWQTSGRETQQILNQFHHHWTRQAICADMIKSMVKSVEEQSRSVQDSDRPTAVTSHGSDKGDGSSSGVSPLMSFVMANDTNYKQKVYKPLLKRPTADTLEDRVRHYEAKRLKLDQPNDASSNK